MKDEYISKLKIKIEEAGYDSKYSDCCCNYATRLLENDVPVIFDIEHFAKLVGTSKEFICKLIFAEELFYKTIEIPKKRGGNRVLDIPSMELKYIQRWILDNILEHIPVSENATGFKKHTSIVNNAKRHVNKDCLINIDIKDFFPSIDFVKVYKVFSYYGYTKEISFILAKLCTYKDRLPQGSPASPALSNIVCLKLDARLDKLAEKYNASYSRYADDITFSGPYGINKLAKIAGNILVDEGFTVNDKKTRIAYSYQRQEVTGIIVNNTTIRVSKQYKRKLWQEIYYCKKFGVTNHLENIGCTKLFYKEHLYGKAYFVNMVEPEEGKKILDSLREIEWSY